MPSVGVTLGVRLLFFEKQKLGKNWSPVGQCLARTRFCCHKSVFSCRIGPEEVVLNIEMELTRWMKRTDLNFGWSSKLHGRDVSKDLWMNQINELLPRSIRYVLVCDVNLKIGDIKLARHKPLVFDE